MYRTSRYFPSALSLLPPIAYALYWLLLSAPVSSATIFSVSILIADGSGVRLPESLSPVPIMFLAIGSFSLVCMLLLSSRNAALFANLVLAVFKLIMLLVIFITGLIYSGRNRAQASVSGWNNLKPEQTQTSVAGTLSAILLVLFSYSGWQNANDVSLLPMLSEKDTLLTQAHR